MRVIRRLPLGLLRATPAFFPLALRSLSALSDWEKIGFYPFSVNHSPCGRPIPTKLGSPRKPTPMARPLSTRPSIVAWSKPRSPLETSWPFNKSAPI